MSLGTYFREIGWNIRTSWRKLIAWALEHIPDSLTYQIKLGKGDFQVHCWNVTSFVEIGPVTTMLSWGQN